MRGARLLAGAAAVTAAAACAHVEGPPGGPEDKTAPGLIATRPDTMARLETWTGPVVFVFDEGLSEEGVEEAVTLSPRRGPVAVDKEGDEIRVRPRLGWQRGVIYQVEVAPGIRDRFGNRRTEAIRLVFSTGPDIPDTRASGTVTERVSGEPAGQARVDAVRAADSLIYSTVVDSAGGFEFRQVPEGEYRILAYRDANRNGRPDVFEARDSTVLTIAVAAAPPPVELAILLPDTTPPRPGSARMAREWVEVRFDDYLDPEQPLSPAQVTIVGPDGAAVAIAEVRVGPPPEAAPDDSAAADSAAVGQGRLGRTAPRDTGRAAARGPLPSQALFARPASPLLPDTIYTVTVRDVRNVNGLVGGGEVPLRTPEPEPAPQAREPGGPPLAPPDTTPPPPDSAAPSPPDTTAAGRRADAGEPARTPHPDPPARGTAFAALHARSYAFSHSTGS